MGEYLYTLAGASVLIALICALVPEQGQAHLRLLCSLCVVCLVCAPVMTLLSRVADGEWEIPDSWQEREEAQSEPDYGHLSQDLLAGQLQVLLERDMDLPPAECRIFVEWEGEERIASVTLVLSGRAIWRDPDPIAAYVQKLLGCPCVVVLD